MFFYPWDVRQAAWDPCSYRWIIWSKWEIQLCVISIAMVGENLCLYDGSQWCRVCGEEEGSKNWPLRNPSDQLIFCGYLPSTGHLERPTSEIGFKPAKWSSWDVQWWEGGQEDLMINSVKSSRQIQQNEDWWFGISFCNSQGFSDWEKHSLSWMATPETWLFSIQFVVLWKKQWDLVEDNSFECFGYEWKKRDRSVVF